MNLQKLYLDLKGASEDYKYELSLEAFQRLISESSNVLNYKIVINENLGASEKRIILRNLSRKVQRKIERQRK